MESSNLKQVERQLRHLERRNTWMWALAALVMVALGLALVSIQGTGTSTDTGLARDTGYALIVGVSVLVVLFSLYMLLKQHQIQSLRNQLFQAVVREESLRSRLAALSSLFEGVAQIGAPFELEAMLQTLCEHVRTSLEAERSSLMLLDPETRELHCVAVSGRDAELVRRSRVRAGEGISGTVFERGEALALTPDAVAERFPGAAPPARDIRAGLCVPLALPERVIGVLNITRIENPQPFSEEDARMVTLFAAHIALAIRRVNERRQAQEMLREHEEELRQSQKMESLGRLAGGIAHDYNNLLTVILSYGSKLLRGLGAEDPMRQCAEKISEAADRCASLTRQLLTFGRKQEVDLQVLDINARVSETSELLRRLIGENVELVTEMDPGTGHVRVDRNQIEQVLVNLVVNARDALPTGGRVTVGTAPVELDEDAASRHVGANAGAYAMLLVRDTGHGMDRATQAQAFEPFFTTKPDGAGLGLSTVYGVVQQSGGFLSVQSRPGQGTTFRIYLPRVGEVAASAPPPETVRSGATGETILLVEDEEGVRDLIRDILEQEGFRVLAAGWAGEAVMIAESHIGPIELMITDVVMPGESGGELAQWMAQSRPEMPVLFMSGYDEEAVARHGVMNDGVLLQKPFDEEVLLARVRSMIESGAARRAAEQAAAAPFLDGRAA